MGREMVNPAEVGSTIAIALKLIYQLHCTHVELMRLISKFSSMHSSTKLDQEGTRGGSDFFHWYFFDKNWMRFWRSYWEQKKRGGCSNHRPNFKEWISARVPI